MDAEAVTLVLPEWLLEEAHEALESKVGPVSDEEFNQALREVMRRFLERVSGGFYNPRCQHQAELVESYRVAQGAKTNAAAGSAATAR